MIKFVELLNVNSAEWYRKNFTGEIFFDGREKALAEQAT